MTDAAYLKIIERGKSQYRKTKQFMALLAKRKIKGFDATVHRLHDEVFAEISCLACGHCCRKLGPAYVRHDIERMSDELNLSAAAFTERYLRTDEDGDLVYRTLPCPFLEPTGLCRHYEARPKACREYPHTDEKNMQRDLLRLADNTLYCPAAVLIAERLQEMFSR